MGRRRSEFIRFADTHETAIESGEYSAVSTTYDGFVPGSVCSINNNGDNGNVKINCDPVNKRRCLNSVLMLGHRCRSYRRLGAKGSYLPL